MKWFTCLIALLAVLLGGGRTSIVNTGTQQPTPAAASVGFPATDLSWSAKIVRLDSSKAQAVMTALVLEDTARHAVKG